MNTSELVRLICQGVLSCGAYTVDIKPGSYSEILGSKVLVYTHSKPDADILAFSVREFLLICRDARELPIHKFKSLILAKKMFGGTITEEVSG